MKPRQWLERGRREADPFNRLSEVWRAFNNLFFSIDGHTEQDKIRTYITGKLTKADAAVILEKHKRAITILLDSPVIDMRGNGRDTKPSMDAFQNAATSQEKVQALFAIAYQVRCNLEHGQKSPERERDASLCASASDIVAHIVSLYAE